MSHCLSQSIHRQWAAHLVDRFLVPILEAPRTVVERAAGALGLDLDRLLAALRGFCVFGLVVYTYAGFVVILRALTRHFG